MSQMPIGYIAHLNVKKRYGFIDSPEIDREHIFFHITRCLKSYKHTLKGDKVSFELEILTDNKVEAKNIDFVQNASLAGLRKDFENGTILRGFLKKIEEKYYVKDRETYIYIQLIIADYETNLKEIYEDNLNKSIEYKIVRLTNKNKIRAININRQFLTGVKCLFVGNQTEGIVTGKVKSGYQIKIQDDILGFIPNSLVLKRKGELQDGELINVTCIKSDEKFGNVIFDLTENIDFEKKIKIEQDLFVASLKTGDKFIGKITDATGYGIFVRFGLSEGMLHINNIIPERTSLSKSSQKEFAKIVEKVFPKGQQIEVIIAEKDKDRTALNWDKLSVLNKGLCEEINAKYKILSEA